MEDDNHITIHLFTAEVVFPVAMVLLTIVNEISNRFTAVDCSIIMFIYPLFLEYCTVIIVIISIAFCVSYCRHCIIGVMSLFYLFLVCTQNRSISPHSLNRHLYCYTLFLHVILYIFEWANSLTTCLSPSNKIVPGQQTPTFCFYSKQTGSINVNSYTNISLY